MWEVELMYMDGIPTPRGEKARKFIGIVNIQEEFVESRRRHVLVATVYSEATYGKRGAIKMHPHRLAKPLYDVRLLHVSGVRIVVTGYEEEPDANDFEITGARLQTWVMKPI